MGNQRSTRRTEKGFTLIELVVAIAIVAVLLAVGVPSLRDMVVSQRVRSAANSLYSDLTFARSEAIKRNVQVSIVRAEGGWINGWTVEASGTPIRAQGRLSDISYSGAADSTIVYKPDGRSTLTGSVSLNFAPVSGSVARMRCVAISPSGRPAVLTDSNQNGNCQDG